ncbi:hypothetical protein AYO43_03515 [Nitrospira sp. SCGC AG-212-E16]|nr:hypothetical protein AYO43_03515 [Nitrospira sp. SCGC AG-212-E16]
MSTIRVSNRETPTLSAGMAHAGPDTETTGPAKQTSKGAWAHDRIRAEAYALYEQRGRQDGRALEDWLHAERQAIEVVNKS